MFSSESQNTSDFSGSDGSHVHSDDCRFSDRPNIASQSLDKEEGKMSES